MKRRISVWPKQIIQLHSVFAVSKGHCHGDLNKKQNHNFNTPVALIKNLGLTSPTGQDSNRYNNGLDIGTSG